MSELKHTPGPWGLIDGMHQHEWVSNADRCMWVETFDGTWVAVAHGADDETVLGNALLIAAAPAMLQALRRLQGCLPVIFEALNLDPDETFVRVSDSATGQELVKVTLGQILTEQDAAIAAATGGA